MGNGPLSQHGLSSCDLAGLRDVDGLGELPGAPRAAAQPAQMCEVLSWALARSPGLRSWAWARLAQPGSGQLAQDAQILAAAQVVHSAGQRPGHPYDLAVWGRDDLQVHPVTAVLTGVERPVGGHPVDGD
jgi:hypothetical protein